MTRAYRLISRWLIHGAVAVIIAIDFIAMCVAAPLVICAIALDIAGDKREKSNCCVRDIRRARGSSAAVVECEGRAAGPTVAVGHSPCGW